MLRAPMSQVGAKVGADKTRPCRFRILDSWKRQCARVTSRLEETVASALRVEPAPGVGLEVSLDGRSLREWQSGVASPLAMASLRSQRA